MPGKQPHTPAGRRAPGMSGDGKITVSLINVWTKHGHAGGQGHTGTCCLRRSEWSSFPGALPHSGCPGRRHGGLRLRVYAEKRSGKAAFHPVRGKELRGLDRVCLPWQRRIGNPGICQTARHFSPKAPEGQCPRKKKPSLCMAMRSMDPLPPPQTDARGTGRSVCCQTGTGCPACA